MFGADLREAGALDSGGQNGPVGDQVGVGARVGLHVCVICAKNIHSQGCRQAFDGVDVVAAGVEAVEGVALGVLVCKQVRLCKLNRQGRKILAGDHLEVASLVRQLGNDAAGDIRRDRCDLLQRSKVGDESGVRRVSAGCRTGEVPREG